MWLDRPYIEHLGMDKENMKHHHLGEYVLNFSQALQHAKFKLLPSGKLTWQWKMDLLKMYSLLKMLIFHCHVSLLEGSRVDGRCLFFMVCFWGKHLVIRGKHSPETIGPVGNRGVV